MEREFDRGLSLGYAGRVILFLHSASKNGLSIRDRDMQGSIERVRAVINGQMPDRAPLYDLLRNDAVISHFAGRRLTVENGPEVVFKAYEPAIDATRPLVRTPNEEHTVTLGDGRQDKYYRWTIWNEPVKYPDSKAYQSAKRSYLESFDAAWNEQKQQEMAKQLASIADHKQRLGEVFFFPATTGVELMHIYHEVGLEDFSYYLVDCPDVITELLECNTLSAISWIEHLPQEHQIEAVFLGDDIAFGSGLFFQPRWFAKHYLPRLARVISAYHARKIKVLFHSDGNLNPILDGLVEAGIDGLNPIEVLAGMDVAAVHRTFPNLFLAGGVDVSQLLPFGKPQEIKDTVRRIIDAAQGRIMIGSTSELLDYVPLENFLAMRQAVLDNPYH